MTTLYTELSEKIEKHLTGAQIDILRQAVAELQTSKDLDNDLLFHSASVKRTFVTPENEANLLAFQGVSFSIDMAIRCYYILISLSLTLQLHAEASDNNKIIHDFVKHYYQYGDEFEKFVLLRSLPIIDSQGFALQVAINACRCNNVLEFSEIALNNVYPSAHFPELNFNQMVLKSLFMGLNITSLVGLETRKNGKLSNMCFAYAIEQALAERIPPSSLWLAVDLDHLEGDNLAQKDQFIKHFCAVDEQHKAEITRQFNC